MAPLTWLGGIPILNLPQRLPMAVLLLGSAIVLAGLDIAGAMAAKEWARRGSPLWFAVGAAMFVLLFWVYASTLQYAELAVVTFGWIVILQVALLLVDRFVYGVEVHPSKWAAAGAILVLQGYLVLGPSKDS
jgi:drug/metabolite transporter superfamily protein YnfA